MHLLFIVLCNSELPQALAETFGEHWLLTHTGSTSKQTCFFLFSLYGQDHGSAKWKPMLEPGQTGSETLWLESVNVQHATTWL